MPKEPQEIFYVNAAGVTLICHSKDNVLEWVEFILDKGWAPTVEKRAA